jgi:hypothetical protein
MIIELNEKEQAYVDGLAAKQGITPQQVIIHALRLYQLQDWDQAVLKITNAGAGWPDMD